MDLVQTSSRPADTCLVSRTTSAPKSRAAGRDSSEAGTRLPDDLWEARHAWMLRILYFHLPALLGVALAFDYSLAHAMQEAAVVLALTLAATHVHSRRSRALVMTAALLTCSALLVHLTGGLIEAHFHCFVAVILLGFYESRAVYALAVVFVLAHHGVLGTQFAEAAPVFDHPSHPGV